MDFRQTIKSTLYSKFDETPIDDFQPLTGPVPGSAKAKTFDTPGSFDKTDRQIITNPTAVDKIRRQFSGWPDNLNFYFINNNTLRKSHAEYGEVQPDDIAGIIGDENASKIKSDPNGTSVIFIGNAAADKKMMTAWIMAHRFSHVLSRYRSSDRVKSAWNEYTRSIHNMLAQALEGYGYHDIDHRQVSKLMLVNGKANPICQIANAIGTFKSARDNKIDRPMEFCHEVFAQYVITGKIEFKSLPQRIKTKDGIRTIYNAHDHEYYSEIVKGYEDVLAQDIDKLRVMAHGKTFIM